MKEQTVVQRMFAYLAAKNITKAECEVSLGMSRGYLSRAANITAEYITKFACIYSDCSMEWLIRGEGAMLLEHINKAILETRLESIQLVAHEQQKMIDNLRNQIKRL